MTTSQQTERYTDVHFPSAGVDRSLGFGKQPNRPSGRNGQYRRTCAIGNNVRAYDPRSDRIRGGARPGLVKYLGPQVAGSHFVVQDLIAMTGVGYTPPGGGTVQQSLSGRVVSLVAVSEGRVFSMIAGGTSFTEASNLTGETPALNFTGVMFSAPNQQKLWFVDGINSCVFSPADNSLRLWTALAGTFPIDSDGNLPTLVELWRGRLLLSGLLKDPQNIFASRVDDPTDFDYGPESPSALDPWALNLSGGLGLIGDAVMSMIPYTDNMLIVGCAGSTHIIRGDPLDGGQADVISSSIGMVWGRPWAMDPFGNIYFFSNRCGIYSMDPRQGGQPQRISQAIDPILQSIDTGENIVRMLWWDRTQSLHVFVTNLNQPQANQHYCWESRANAWFTDTFGNNNHNPLCCCVFDGNTPQDRVALLGGWDGHVYALSTDAVDDAGTEIDSNVVIGPIITKDFDDVTLMDLQAVMAKDSEDVEYDILVGETAEEALASEPFESGVWNESWNENTYVNLSAHAIYVRVRSRRPWAIESIRARLRARGKVRMRQQ